MLWKKSQRSGCSFVERTKNIGSYQKNDKLFLLSNHGQREKQFVDIKIMEENYDDYIINLENVAGFQRQKCDKRIILSGAFPECDEIYKYSLLEALSVYSKEIIKKGYKFLGWATSQSGNVVYEDGEKVKNLTSTHLAISGRAITVFEYLPHCGITS